MLLAFQSTKDYHTITAFIFVVYVCEMSCE
jgi:hypothetical protein